MSATWYEWVEWCYYAKGETPSIKGLPSKRGESLLAFFQQWIAFIVINWAQQEKQHISSENGELNDFATLHSCANIFIDFSAEFFRILCQCICKIQHHCAIPHNSSCPFDEDGHHHSDSYQRSRWKFNPSLQFQKQWGKTQDRGRGN